MFSLLFFSGKVVAIHVYPMLIILSISLPPPPSLVSIERKIVQRANQRFSKDDNGIADLDRNRVAEVGSLSARAKMAK